MRAGILLMAAGKSQRYQEACGQHKLMVRHSGYNDLPLLTRNLQLATTLCGKRVNVVLRPDAHEMIALAERAHCAFTLLPSEGLGYSIAAGVAAQPDWPGWLIMLADMPWLQYRTVKRVGKALAFADIVRPEWRHQPGHPVGFSSALRDSLMALTGDDGAKSILLNNPPLLLKVNDPGCVYDIDIPADWQVRRD